MRIVIVLSDGLHFLQPLDVHERRQPWRVFGHFVGLVAVAQYGMFHRDIMLVMCMRQSVTSSTIVTARKIAETGESFQRHRKKSKMLVGRRKCCRTSNWSIRVMRVQ